MIQKQSQTEHFVEVMFLTHGEYFANNLFGSLKLSGAMPAGANSNSVVEAMVEEVKRDL